jgi:PEP-CTERM motif
MKTLSNVKRVAFGIALYTIVGAANAFPSLQLGIAGGTYDNSSETIIASSTAFSLYAYLIPNGKNPINDIYTISMSVSPQIHSSTNLGSFTVNGDVINVSSGMNYGIPPADATIETAPGGDSHDLETHSVFPTYFTQRSFSFSLLDKSAKFDTADHPSFGPQAGTGMYFKKFDIDVSNLDPNYSIHFDLYNTAEITKTDCITKYGKKVCTTTPTGQLDITDKAPFSHDAQSGHGGGGPPNETPEPATLLLIAFGLFFLANRQKQLVARR